MLLWHGGRLAALIVATALTLMLTEMWLQDLTRFLLKVFRYEQWTLAEYGGRFDLLREQSDFTLLRLWPLQPRR